MNHAVVNEDPNARIIRELRAEVEALKDMLLHAAQPAVLKEKLSENEKLMQVMSLTWEEKLQNTEQKQEDRRQALEKMGISVQSSGIKVEKNKYFLVNLNADPCLNELLVYYLKEDTTLVGRPEAGLQQDIQLIGLGIQDEHCRICRVEMDLYLEPLPGARTCVNGAEITTRTQLLNGDRILWGSNHFFRVNCPKVANSEPTPTTPFDWRMAQEEVMQAEVGNAPMREAIARLERQYEVDKKNALENQRKEYEKQFQQLKSYMSPSTPLAPSLQYDPFRTCRMTHSTSVISRLEKWGKEQDDSFKQGISKLREAIVMANGLVREANFISAEMGKTTSFSVTLQIPPHKLTPNRKLGTFISEPAILVRRKDSGNQIWSTEKLEMKLIDMREVYEDVRRNNVGTNLPDPFYETKEHHHLIGVANIFLDVLFHDVKLDYQTPIISQQGEVCGRLSIELEKTGGSLGTLGEGGGGSRFKLEDETNDNYITCRLIIKAATGLPPSLSQFVFCQYSFPGEGELITIPPSLNPDPRLPNGKLETSVNFKFDHSREISLLVGEELLELCSEGALSIEVYGHSSSTLLNAWEMEEQKAKATSLADRWSELTRKLNFKIEIHELDETGVYSPVEVAENEDVATGGIFQLKQGQQRRLLAQVEPIINSGTLPLICDSILSIEIGSPCVRNKLQRPLDSYQEEDLTLLRESWSQLLDKRREYLNSQIQMYINKLDKSELECEREVSLVDQWVHLTDERNTVIAPTPGSGVPGAPHPTSYKPKPGTERHFTVLFLDLNADDFSTGVSGSDNEIPVYGINSILPKELSGKFFNLPIIGNMEEGCGAVSSWDSSIHESVFINRITRENERVYIIVKAVVRLSHPAPMDLVLRKRLCISIVKRQSIKEKIKKTLGRSRPLQSVSVVYEIVSNVPKASAELEDRKSLAVIAASGTDTESDNGETFIERYTRGVSAVDTILFLDRLRQNVVVKEALKSQGKVQKSMRKTVSVPNFSNMMRSSSSQDNLAGLQRIKCSMSVQDFNQEAGRPGRRPRMELATVPEVEGGEADNIARPTFLNLGSALNTRSELNKLSPNQPNPKKISRLIVHNKENIDGREELKGTQIRSKVTSSQTLESLAELPKPGPCTPSLNSSGYGSQAVSSNTLSSEDSLSVNSISVDETPDHEQGMLSLNILKEQSSMLSPPDLSLGSSSPCEETDVTVTETTPSSSSTPPPCSTLPSSSPTPSSSCPNGSMDGSTSSLSTSLTSLEACSSPNPEQSLEPRCSRRSCLGEDIPGWLKVGESVQIRPSNLSGVVQYLGRTEFAPGTWVGVELDTSQGKNDGSVKGIRYFSCQPKKGVFVKPKNLKLDKRGKEMRARR